MCVVGFTYQHDEEREKGRNMLEYSVERESVQAHFFTTVTIGANTSTFLNGQGGQSFLEDFKAVRDDLLNSNYKVLPELLDWLNQFIDDVEAVLEEPEVCENYMCRNYVVDNLGVCGMHYDLEVGK